MTIVVVGTLVADFGRFSKLVLAFLLVCSLAHSKYCCFSRLLVFWDGHYTTENQGSSTEKDRYWLNLAILLTNGRAPMLEISRPSKISLKTRIATRDVRAVSVSILLELYLAINLGSFEGMEN